MKLHDIPNRNYVRISQPGKGREVRVPPGAPVLEVGQVIFFDHIDGMYSYCKTLDGRLVHLVAWAEVEPLTEREIAQAIMEEAVHAAIS
jgi:hypothetical protein